MRFDGPFAKDGSIITSWNFNHQSFAGAFVFEVLVDALAEHGGMDPDGVVCGSVIIHGAAEDLLSYFLLVDFLGGFVENSSADVDEHGSQT